MKEKLTIADAMKYPNAKLKYNPDEIFNYSFNREKCSEVGKVSIIRVADEIQLIDGDVIVWTKIDNCKLILRSIEDLTEEEKEVLIQLHQDSNTYDPGTIVYLDFERVAQGDYCRSINIDIDEFLESGKAVKE